MLYDADETTRFFERILDVPLDECGVVIPKRGSGVVLVLNFLGNIGATVWAEVREDSRVVQNFLRPDPEESSKTPQVYLVAVENDNENEFIFKIGASIDPETRLHTLQTSHYDALSLEGQWEVADPGDLLTMFRCERRVHALLRRYGGPLATGDAKPKGGREWFRIRGYDQFDYDNLVQNIYTEISKTIRKFKRNEQTFDEVFDMNFRWDAEEAAPPPQPPPQSSTSSSSTVSVGEKRTVEHLSDSDDDEDIPIGYPRPSQAREVEDVTL
jgi:hypothetical protein